MYDTSACMCVCMHDFMFVSMHMCVMPWGVLWRDVVYVSVQLMSALPYLCLCGYGYV